MMKPSCETTIVVRKRNLKNNYYALTCGPYSKAGQCRPGHFIHIKLPATDVYFRRAMSVAWTDADNELIEFVFKVVGRGTTLMSKMKKGDQLDILGPLGNKFTRPRKNERAIIVAGGIGLPPVLYMAENLVEHGFDPGQIELFYGGRSSHDIIERTRIKKTGIKFHATTDDGSFGQLGLVTQYVEELVKTAGNGKLRLYACGPEPMLKAVDDLGRKYGVPGQLSLEAPMPCGIGVCLGCVVPLRNGGHARVCADGPVFEIGEVIL